MLTEIECMLAELRHLGRVLDGPDLPEGPRNGAAPRIDHARTFPACVYCAGLSGVACADATSGKFCGPGRCNVKSIEQGSSSRSDDR